GRPGPRRAGAWGSTARASPRPGASPRRRRIRTARSWAGQANPNKEVHGGALPGYSGWAHADVHVTPITPGRVLLRGLQPYEDAGAGARVLSGVGGRGLADFRETKSRLRRY